MLQYQQILATIATVLNVVSAVGAVAFPTVEPLIAKALAVLAGASALTPPTSLEADSNDILAILKTIEESGVVPAGTAAAAELAEAQAVMAKFAATLADLKRGDLAIVDDNVDIDGVPSILCLMAKGGQAAQQHGM